MILNRFFINVFVRVVLITSSGVILGIVLQHLESGYYYTLSGTILLIIIQAWLLVNEVNKTNRDLEKFFSSVGNFDSSVRLSKEANNTSFNELHDRMNSVNTIIQTAKIENERTSRFLQSIVDHVDAGLLSFDMNGTVIIYNKAAKKYLKVQQPGRIDALKSKDEELFRIINTIRPGQEILHKIKTDNNLQSVLIKAARLTFEGSDINLIIFQDITSELDKKELDSWQKIIRVLTHEIMNSISPITSLTSVISGYFKHLNEENKVQPVEISHQIVSKTLSGLDTIEETGKGLLDFVNKYRSLTSLPKPDLSIFPIGNLFRACIRLMENCIPDNIKITEEIHPGDISLEADYSQIEQVMINLIKNSEEALSGRAEGTIYLKAFYTDGSTVIQVEDNGTGIPDNIIDDVCVPFYTTKENGSGIGLSLSKQIMQNHGGTISVSSTPNEKTCFTLKFWQKSYQAEMLGDLN
jgi:nitrogen fixation/metabolism regulation signal transduction histidine kinase